VTRTMTQLLVASGFRVWRNRADCRACDGSSGLTVSISEPKGLAYCHRCEWTATRVQLAKQQGITIPEKKIGLALLRKLRFMEWLGVAMTTMARREHQLARRAEWAKAALCFYPGLEPAWAILAQWYHARRSFEIFWQEVRDRIGRRSLYVAWRKRQ
jgi:hypothetical protein